MSVQTTVEIRPSRRGASPSRPRVPDVHLFRSSGRPVLFAVASGRLYEIDEMLAGPLEQAMDYGDTGRVTQFLALAGLPPPVSPGPPPVAVPVRGLSLAVAQQCNLACSYCYAEQGSFGGAETSMDLDVAHQAVDRLLAGASPSEQVNLTFLGGEPLAARRVLRAATEYAAERAAAAGVDVAFSLTTNATMLTEDDATFFDRYGFAVTISIDGVGEAHDRLRPFKSGRGTYEQVVRGVRLLLSRSPRRVRLTARVSVTPRNLALPETLEALAGLGFDGVLFSPVLRSPGGADELDPAGCEILLAQLLQCGRIFEARLREGTVYPFLNVLNALRRIHERRPDAYPCGAGGGYLAVSAQGDLAACHRFVGDEAGAMGTLAAGVDPAKQRIWLSERNVHAQEPCRTCWARHLCGGGCHHEVIHRGRPACDYIRGWLHYCLGLYAALLHDNPPLLGRILHPQPDG